MEKEEIYIDKLKEAVAETFGRTLDSPNDFDLLSIQIRNKTTDIISPSTLKRLFGYIQPSTIPRTSTLSSLARYVGYKGWSDFCQIQNTSIPTLEPQKKKYIYRRVIWRSILVIAIASLIYIAINQKSDELPHSTESGQSIATSQSVYEQILDDCLLHTKAKCDSLREYRSEMNMMEYYRFINDEYIALTFEYMDNYIKERIEAASLNDEFMAEKYYNDIFAQCRDWNVGLIREMVPEYNETIKKE